MMRALVTRPREEFLTTAAALAHRAIEVVSAPLLEIRYLAPPLPDLAAAQAVLCTSGNGVRALAQATTERAVPLFAVGDATARCARDAGFATVTSAGGAVADLAALVTGRLRPAAGPLVQVAGTAIAGDLAGILGGAGFTVDRAVLYEARPIAALSPETVQAIAARTIDFALFFSPRTAAIFVRLAALAGVGADCAAIIAVALSPAVDAALAELVWRDRLVAHMPRQAALLAAVDKAVGDERRGARNGAMPEL